MTDITLDGILDTLEHSRQRATYGAVASLLGKTPRALMRGRERAQHHSWIVNRNNGLPTGYDEALLHPELAQNAHIIDSLEELEAFLGSNTLTVAAKE